MIVVAVLSCGHKEPFVDDRPLPLQWYCSTCKRTVTVDGRVIGREAARDAPPS